MNAQKKPAQELVAFEKLKVLSISASGAIDNVAMLKKMRISVHNPFNQSTLPVFVQPSLLHKGFLKINNKINSNETFQFMDEYLLLPHVGPCGGTI